MGNFYVNFTVKCDDPLRCASVLKQAGRKAVITPPLNGTLVVFEEESDSQDPQAIEAVGALLSRGLSAPVLGVLDHDDDILAYWLFEDGRLSDTYDSHPDYFNHTAKRPPAGGDAQRLCAAFSVPAAAPRVDAILRDANGYLFAVERHEALVAALGLPEYALGMGYEYLSRDECPEELDPDQLIHVG